MLMVFYINFLMHQQIIYYT